ncbi:MAG TPA: helix-turn-helix domain-containing protein [Acidimicrobiales bacterium]
MATTKPEVTEPGSGRVAVRGADGGAHGSADRSADRPLRADARRNRARLLEAAHAVFRERGTDASLDEVARRAGVGAGTLYRHFPTRDDLVEALVRADVDQLAQLSRDLTAAPGDPDAALRTWLLAFVRHAMAFRGLAEALVAAAGSGTCLDRACHDTEVAAAAVVERARAAGRLRPDASVQDTLNLAAAVAWLAERDDDPDAPARLLDLVLDGLRPS